MCVVYSRWGVKRDRDSDWEPQGSRGAEGQRGRGAEEQRSKVAPNEAIGQLVNWSIGIRRRREAGPLPLSDLAIGSQRQGRG
jgi:hypothetical protein